MTIRQRIGVSGFVRLHFFALAMLALVIGPSIGLADEKVAVSPPESWVEILPLPEADPKRAWSEARPSNGPSIPPATR